MSDWWAELLLGAVVAGYLAYCRWTWRTPQPDANRWRREHPDFNPYAVHNYMWPECREPMPHGHDLGVLARRDD